MFFKILVLVVPVVSKEYYRCIAKLVCMLHFKNDDPVSDIM